MTKADVFFGNFVAFAKTYSHEKIPLPFPFPFSKYAVFIPMFISISHGKWESRIPTPDADCRPQDEEL